MGDLSVRAQVVEGRITALDLAPELLDLPDRPGQYPCPLCKMTTRQSLTLYPGDRGWWCFACETGGRAVAMVEASRGLSKEEAVKWLEARLGIGKGSSVEMVGEMLDVAARRRERVLLEAEEHQLDMLRGAVDRLCFDACRVRRFAAECFSPGAAEPVELTLASLWRAAAEMRLWPGETVVRMIESFSRLARMGMGNALMSAYRMEGEALPESDGKPLEIVRDMGRIRVQCRLLEKMRGGG